METQKEYFETLDIFRFLAFFVVFISHISIAIFLVGETSSFKKIAELFLVNGKIGVSFFFTLSGFLITYLLLKEKQRGGINIKKFFVRRLLRIWPVYFLVVGTVFIALPLLAYFLKDLGLILPAAATEGTALSRLPWFVFFLANFASFGHGPENFAAGVLWSVSVEEQFYLTWPWIISYVPIRHLTKVLVGLIILSTFYRFYFNIFNYATLSVLSDLVFGALLAHLVLLKDWPKRFFGQSPASLTWLAYGLIIILIPLSKLTEQLLIPGRETFINLIATFFPLVFSFLFAFIIGKNCFGSHQPVSSKLGKTLIYLGTISYGLYCYHALAILMAKTISLTVVAQLMSSLQLHIAESVLALALTIALAMLSYRYIESPILALKRRFG